MAQLRFNFISDAAGGDMFTVISFSAHEAISTLYEYQVEVRAPLSAAISLDDVLNTPARFVTQEDGKDFPVHGILSNFEELQTVQGYVHYRAVLVPRLWSLSIYKTNEIYTEEKTVDIIIQTVLENAGLQGDSDFDLSGLDKNRLLSRDYVCQFGESDFDFISRLMEKEGIFYYFEQGSGPAEKIIFINDMNYETITRPGLIFDVTAQTRNQHDSVNGWSCRKQRLSAGVTVRDFNPDQPSLDISDTVPIDQMSLGTDYYYGENIRDTDEATYLSEIRAEESLCNKTRFYAESSVARLHSGYLFELDMHPNDTYNGVEYLAIEVDHEGRQLDAYLSPDPDQGTKQGPQYRNNLVAIQADEQYRPPRKTRKPRFYGTMTAFIHAETGVNRAEIDEYGRYRVHMPFDRADGAKESTDSERKASAWIRMAQNYVGEGKGSYYPLTGGTEVLLSFINGDPDQPIIVGAVPNASEPSLLTSENEFESTVQTGSGNRIRMGDIEGEDRIVMESPTAHSWMRIGTPNDPYVVDNDPSADGVKISSDGDYELVVGGNVSETVTSDATRTISGSSTQTVSGDASQIISGEYVLHASEGSDTISFEMKNDGVVLNTGGKSLTINTGDAEFKIDCGNYTTNNKSESDTTKWAMDSETFYGNKFEWMFGGTEEFYVGGKVEVCVAEAFELFVGAKQEVLIGSSMEFYLNLLNVSIGTGFQLDLNFSLGFEYAPIMFEKKGVQAKQEDLKAEQENAALISRVANLETHKIKLHKAVCNLNRATAKIDMNSLYIL